jgi:hypothetical protein
VSRHRPEVADVIAQSGSTYQRAYGTSLEQRQILRALTACRTAALGGHQKQCMACGHEAIAYNSCRNRHCPKCQAAARAQWLEARAADLIAVPYFHVVFTLPEPLGPLALQNKRLLYGMLFRAASETLCTIARDPQHLGAEIGFLAVLHTWGQNLQHHPHLHCVVPGGGIAPGDGHWVPSRKQFFLPVRVLSRLFRGKFLSSLRAAFDQGTLALHGRLERLADGKNWCRLLTELEARNWVVYAKPPFGGPTQVLKYLARYTHRVAISNRRLVSLGNGKVTFRWKDYAQGNRTHMMTLDAVEFIRRFLLHSLPKGFQRIRQYGFLANRVRHEKLPLCRALLRGDKEDATLGDGVAGDEAGTTGVAPSEAAAADESCPACRQGRMIVVGIIEPASRYRRDHPAPQPFDTDQDDK